MSRRRKAVHHKPAPRPDRQPEPAVTQEISQHVAVFRGPLPPPDLLKAYNEAHPDAADRILRMTEAQGAHRRMAEEAIVKESLIRARRGQVFGFVIAMTAILGGIALLFFDKSIQGYATIGTGMASLVVAFTIGRVSQTRSAKPMSDPEREA